MALDQMLVAREMRRCRTNPIYFLQTYCKVKTKGGSKPFEMYEFQKEKCIKQFLMYDAISIVKGRQTGVSTVVAGYIL